MGRFEEMQELYWLSFSKLFVFSTEWASKTMNSNNYRVFDNTRRDRVNLSFSQSAEVPLVSHSSDGWIAGDHLLLG